MSLPRAVAPDRQQLDFCSIHSHRASSSTFGLDRPGRAREVERVEVLLDRELGVLDPRGHRVGGAGGQLELGQAEQELGERLVARGGVPRQRLELPAHRRQAQLPEVGLEQLGRDIGHRHIPFLRIKGSPGPTVGPGHREPVRRRTTLTGLSAAGPLRSWSKRLRSGSGTWTWGVADGFGRRRRTAARRGLDRGERPRPLDDGLGAVEVLAPAGLDRPAHASQGVLAQQLQDPHEPAGAGQSRRGALPARRGSRRSTRGASSRGRPARGPARRACGPASPGSGAGRGPSSACSSDRSCVATTWPRATITTRST